MKPGDRVRYTGSDYSTLYFGPGIIEKVTGAYAWVRPTVLGDLGQFMPSGMPVEDKTYLFALKKLEPALEVDVA